MSFLSILHIGLSFLSLYLQCTKWFRLLSALFHCREEHCWVRIYIEMWWNYFPCV